MQTVLRKVTHVLYENESIIKNWRRQRLNSFLSLVKPPSQARILDLGGTPYMWQLIDHDFDLTLVNLPDIVKQTNQPGYTFVEGDATDLSGLFKDKSFDIVFSNSVIEHVGDQKKQAAFASEVKRLANGYWVQTPSDRFPIEPHTGFPYYWNLPEFARDHLKQTWRKKFPLWTDMVEGTCVITRKQMSDLFPEAEFYIERKLIFEKSYAAYRPFE